MALPFSSSNYGDDFKSALGTSEEVGKTTVNLNENSEIGDRRIEHLLTFATVATENVPTSSTGSLQRNFLGTNDIVTYTPPYLGAFQNATQVGNLITAAAPDLSSFQNATQVGNLITAAAPDLSSFQNATQVGNLITAAAPTAGSQITISGGAISLANAIAVNYLSINNAAGSTNKYTLVNETIASNNGATVDSFGIKYNNTYVFKIASTGTVHLAHVLFTPYNVSVNAQNLSDDRYKSRERPLPNDSLSIIQQLKPSRYLLHPDHEVPVDDEDSDLTGVETHEQAGLIAQDLEKISELAFMVHEHEGVKTVEYNSIIPYLIKSIQELANRVSALE